MGTNNIHQYETVMVTEIQDPSSDEESESTGTAASMAFQRTLLENQVSKFNGKIATYRKSNAVITFTNSREAILCGKQLQEEGMTWCAGIHRGEEASPTEELSVEIINFGYFLCRLAGEGDIFISGRVQADISDDEYIKTTSLGSYTSEFMDQPCDIYAVCELYRNTAFPKKAQVQKTAELESSYVRQSGKTNALEGAFNNGFNEPDSSSRELLDGFHSNLSKNAEYAFSAAAKPFNWEAYETFLKGKFYWEAWTGTSVLKAIKCFQKAITISPRYVEAYGWLANCYCILGIMGKTPSWRALEKAERITQKAKSIDPTTGEVLMAQGLVDAFFYRDFKKANASFEQAFHYRICPHFYHLYARFLLAVGKTEPAKLHLEKALQLEPDNVLFNAELGGCYYYNRLYAEALEQFEYTLDLEPAFHSALTGKGWTHMILEEYDEAHEDFECYQNLVYHEQKNVPELVYLSAKLGMRDVADHFLDVLQLGEENVSKEVTSIDIALIYFALDKYGETFYHLQRAVDDYIGEAMNIKSNPLWDRLRNDIRYKKLLRQMNLINTEFYLSEISC